MKKITIYAVHSSKLNYKEEFYKPLLLSKVCEQHNLILPFTDKYKNMYAKDLVESSDIVIVNLTNATLSVLLETNWAIKMNKIILFLVKENEKINFLFNKYKKISRTYHNTEDQKEIIDEFIKENIENVASSDESGATILGSLN